MSTTEHSSSDRAPVGRVGQLFLTGAIVVALIGFVIGIDQGAPRPESDPPAATVYIPPGATLPAMSYAEVRESRIGPNASWRSDLSRLPRTLDREPPSPAEAAAPEARARSLMRRASNRAYAGAPPAVPHAVDQFAPAMSCMACHDAGVRIGAGVASPLPHEFMTNCLQCHAFSGGPDFEAEALTTNGFAGVADPAGGERAWPGAPPVMPHTTFMRENCLSCHGSQGAAGLRTSHPYRTECLQCHASSAAMNNGAPPSLESIFMSDRRPEGTTEP